jgi:hypothetical protein
MNDDSCSSSSTSNRQSSSANADDDITITFYESPNTTPRDRRPRADNQPPPTRPRISNERTTIFQSNHTGSHANSNHAENFQDDDIIFRDIFDNCLPLDRSGTAISTRMTRSRVSELLEENAVQDNLKYIDLQLLRIISPINVAGTKGAYVYSNKSTNRNTGNQTNYTRLFLVRIYSEIEGFRLAYMMETRIENRSLWSHNVELRDNGVLSIGTVFRLLAPRPITNLMAGDIPLLVSKFPVRILKDPKTYLPIEINYEIKGNSSFAFVTNNAEISLSGFTPVATSCSGLLCDRQHVDDWNGSDRGCGCYSMHHRRSSIAFQHDVTFSTEFQGNQKDVVMHGFSSNKFSKLYLSTNLSPSTLIEQVLYTDEFFQLLDKLEQVLSLIHMNGGFTVAGWYKRGMINDKTLVSQSIPVSTMNNNNNNNNESVQVDNGDVNIHITQIVPTNRDFLNPETVLGGHLSSMKFDVTQFH